MLTSRQATLIPRIYDGAASEDLWPQALDAVAEACEAKGAVLFALDQVGMPFSVQTSCSLYDKADIEFYFQNLLRYEKAGWDSLRENPVRTFVRDEDIWPNVDDLRHRPDYAWLYQRANVLRRGAARLNDSAGWTDSVGLQFSACQTRIPRKTVKRIEAVLPHLAKAVELHRSFSILRSRFNAVLTALDHVKVGVCVTSCFGDIIVANAEAERIFALDDGLTISKDKRPVCTSPDASAVLSKAIREAVYAVNGRGGKSEILASVPKRSAAHPFLVEVAPLRDAAGELDIHLRGAIIFIVDPENPRPFSVSNVARCFNLTSAEADVCRLVIEGLVDVDIAAARSVSVQTIRSQIKSIYAKTGTCRRSQLIRLALSITPPIEAPA